MPWPVLASAGAGACEGSEGLEGHLGRGRAAVRRVTPHQGCLPLGTPRACTRYELSRCQGLPRVAVPLVGPAGGPCTRSVSPLGAAACGGSLLAALPLLSHTETLGLSLRGFGQRRGQGTEEGTEEPPLCSVSARRHRPCQAGPARLCGARLGRGLPVPLELCR